MTRVLSKDWIFTIALFLAAPAAAQIGVSVDSAETVEAEEEQRPAAPKERRHTVVKGDTLWDLAKLYYENPFRWKVIYAANTRLIKDPHWIYPDQVFVIPDLPASVLGELGARPVEASAPAVAPEELPAPAEPPQPPVVAGQVIHDDLSLEMPPSLTEQYPSAVRVKMARGWREDGRITEFQGREMLAAQGDQVNARFRIKEALPPGTRFVLYRRDGPEELDHDKKAVYLQWVGVAELKGPGDNGTASLLILKSGGSVQVGDLIKREGT